MREGVHLRQWQRIHVGAQADRRALAGADTQAANDTGPCEIPMNFDAKPFKMSRNDVRRASLVKGKFGVGMQVAAERGNAVMQIVEGLIVLHGESLRREW
jgi:hypothetical protein